MKLFVRLVFVPFVSAFFSAFFFGCITPAWNGGCGNGFVNNGWGQQSWNGGWQQSCNVQPGSGNFVGPGGVVQGNWSQTYQAAQFRAQQQAAGAAPPVGAYQNPYMPLGYVVGTGQPTWSANQCWQQGCVIP